MSKPALGRGLGALLAPTPGNDSAAPSRGASADRTGVQLLLRGENGDPIAPPASFPTTPEEIHRAVALPRWALGSLLLADLILVLVGAWIALGSAAPGRLLMASLVILLGGGLLSLGVWLRGDRGAAELQALNPFDPPKPKVRVRFLEEKK